jgi:hypothetical protein
MVLATLRGMEARTPRHDPRGQDIRPARMARHFPRDTRAGDPVSAHVVTIPARRKPRLPILTPFYVLLLARAWREEIRP